MATQQAPIIQPEAAHRLWQAIVDDTHKWETRAHEAANPADANYALGVAAGLGMALVMVRRVRDGEPINQ